jgi:hypothetical protein
MIVRRIAKETTVEFCQRIGRGHLDLPGLLRASERGHRTASAMIGSLRKKRVTPQRARVFCRRTRRLRCALGRTPWARNRNRTKVSRVSTSLGRAK